MNHRPTVHLAALSAAMLLSANFTPASAKDRTAYSPGTDDSPTAKKGTYISDSAMITGGGSGAKAKAKTSGASIDYSDHDGAGLHAQNARNIAETFALQHAAGLGHVAVH